MLNYDMGLKDELGPMFEVAGRLCLILRFNETLISQSAMYCLEVNVNRTIIPPSPPSMK